MEISSLGQLYLQHRFDLLGSGWNQVRYGMECPGLEGHRYSGSEHLRVESALSRLNGANRIEAQRLRSLIDGEYEPIDWQLDFKSGYRWSESVWYQDVAYVGIPGADIKVPWELGRLQHLPQIALASALAMAEGAEATADLYRREFRNVALDFIAANPPRFGVHWVMPMEVAIRVSNLVLAWDLFAAAEQPLDDAFTAVLSQAVVEHGRHIAENLEWTATFRGNHYLANLVGMVYASAYLPESAETDGWLAFATRSLVEEIELQFDSEGSNREGSTSYHRLSLELATYGAALLLALPNRRVERLVAAGRRAASVLVPGPTPKPVETYRYGDRVSPIPTSMIERIAQGAAFTTDIAKHDGRVPQVGDNDSGRLFKLSPCMVAVGSSEPPQGARNQADDEAEVVSGLNWSEDQLDHRHIVEAIDGLVGRRLQPRVPSAHLDRQVVSSLSRPRPSWGTLGLSRAQRLRIGDPRQFHEFGARLSALRPESYRAITIDVQGDDLLQGQALVGYPAFGLYVFRTTRLYLAIRCGPIGQNGAGGHDHNDQLALELAIDAVDWIRDPGTYVYTPLPTKRNDYRSVTAHAAPQLSGGEPRSLDDGLFTLGAGSHATCVYWGDQGFAGENRMADGRVALCRIHVDRRSIVVEHGAEGASLVKRDGDQGDWRDLVPPLPYSPGYGALEQVSRSASWTP